MIRIRFADDSTLDCYSIRVCGCSEMLADDYRIMNISDIEEITEVEDEE